MNIDVSRHGNKTVVRLDSERLDAAMAVRFKDSLKQVVDTGADHVILDMSLVRFMDSSGLGAIVSHLKYMGAGRVFELASLTPTVNKVFNLTRMTDVFKIYESVAHAVTDDAQAVG